MKKVFCNLLLIIVLSSFVMAGSKASEISMNFMVDGNETEVGNYVPAGNFLDSYAGYIIGFLIILVIGYFVFKMKDKTKTKKVKKISRKRTKKKI